MSNNVSVNEMLDDCEQAASVPTENGGPDFSKWERDFIGSVREQYRERGRLSEKQIDKLTDIWDKI